MSKNFRLSEAFITEAQGTRKGFRLHCVSDIFFPMPAQLGLRGDPYLWASLAAWMRDDLSRVKNFDAEFRAAFKEMTGQDFDSAPESFKVENFSHGGMSSGGVSMEWWRQTGKPLLDARWAALIEQLQP
jgi:hypothetical protein